MTFLCGMPLTGKEQVRIQEGMCGCISPPAVFNYVLNEYIFSVILNLFDNNRPYTLYQACIIENVRAICIIVKHIGTRGENFE